MQDVLDRNVDDDAGPVRVVVAARVALGVNPDLLHRLRIDGAEGHGGTRRGRALHLEERVAVPEVVHREPRPELPSRKARSRIVEELLQRMIGADTRLVVATLGEDDERDGRDDIRDDTNTRVDHGVLVKPDVADCRPVVAVLAGVRRADQRHLLLTIRQCRVGQRNNGAGLVPVTTQSAERGAHTRKERPALGFRQTCAPCVEGWDLPPNTLRESKQGRKPYATSDHKDARPLLDERGQGVPHGVPHVVVAGVQGR